MWRSSCDHVSAEAAINLAALQARGAQRLVQVGAPVVGTGVQVVRVECGRVPPAEAGAFGSPDRAAFEGMLTSVVERTLVTAGVRLCTVGHHWHRRGTEWACLEVEAVSPSGQIELCMANMTASNVLVRVAGRQVDTVVPCRWGISDRPSHTCMVFMYGICRQFRLQGVTRALLDAAGYRHVSLLSEYYGEHASGAANTSIIIACVKPSKHDMGLCLLPNFIDDGCGNQIEVRVSGRASSALGMPPPPPPPRSPLPQESNPCRAPHVTPVASVSGAAALAMQGVGARVAKRGHIPQPIVGHVPKPPACHTPKSHTCPGAQHAPHHGSSKQPSPQVLQTGAAISQLTEPYQRVVSRKVNGMGSVPLHATSCGHVGAGGGVGHKHGASQRVS